jgi:predicted acetyltransferase
MMTVEIRPISDDEVEQAEFIRAYSFNTPDRYDLTRAVERARTLFPNDWSLASFEDGEMTAFLRVIPLAMRINGRGLSFGAVGPVVTLPQHRRKGHVGALLRRALSDMRERGQVLSGLHTPHPALYRRFGWEIASARRVYSFAPKDVRLIVEPRERGRSRMLGPDDWQVADRLYRLHSVKRNGPIHRGEVWWREAIFQQSQDERPDVALWENDRAEPEGYVVYQHKRNFDPGMPPFFVRELVALSTDAYLNLLLYILRHDLPPETTWFASPDDPFHSLIDDQTKVRVREEYDVLLRVCDVESALRLRPSVACEQSVAFTLEVRDASAPWNEGRYRIEVRDGETTVERTKEESDLALSAATLAPLFNGYLSPRAAALAGLLEVRNADALDATERFFATLHRPFCADGF